MNKIFLLISTVLIGINCYSQEINSFFIEKWKTEIGVTTFRTNIIFDDQNNLIIVGSNGKTRALLSDNQDGVYLIDPKTGSVIKHLKIKGAIDGDVNGLAVFDKYLFFGDDNSMFYCFDIKGNKIWEFDISNYFDGETGDVEGCPSLIQINNDDFPDVVFTIEQVGLVALDGKTGIVLWDFQSGSYSGYLNSQAVYDLNNDGIKDVVFGAKNHPESWYGDRVVALNGSDGQLIWENPVNSAVHASSLILKRNNTVEIIATECYSTVSFFDNEGKFLKSAEQSMPSGGISGLFSSPVITDKGLMVIGTSWWGNEDGVWIINIDDKNLESDYSSFTYPDHVKKFTKAGLVSSSAFVADVIKKEKGNEIGICTEKGELLLFDQNGDLIYRLTLPAGVEASPFVKDIDGDGELEILIACLNGYLYCYGTGSKGKVFWGQFRGDNMNQAVIEIKQ